MTIALLVAALLMGFFGSPHCLGMCGGLVTAFGLSMKDVSPAKRRALVATYHFGRLTSYALLGLIAGLIGITVLKPLMMGNSTPRILLGLVLVFVGVTMLGAPFLTKLERFGMRFWQYLSPLRQKVFPLNTFPRALTAGLLWGFLPCGLVYGALLIAVVAHNPLSGAALMFVFGLGTIPMLVATHETVGWLRDKIGRFRLRQLNGAVMVISGWQQSCRWSWQICMAAWDESWPHCYDVYGLHDMSQMNHDTDMAADMDHNMQDMDDHMDHSMNDMSDESVDMNHHEHTEMMEHAQ
ncbi:LOW QUALITY PROTEIN: membrane protein [Psychrobacter sp. JCM 18901]|nr:LOW QUALITY PROTEIN: membrane protein [Psychrobacter sp. JCM 18901]